MELRANAGFWADAGAFPLGGELRQRRPFAAYVAMTQYVALIRGVGPSNPALRNDKLCAALSGAGFKNVAAVLASGNVVFAAPSAPTATLERKVEQVLADATGAAVDVLVRSEAELAALLAEDPFKGAEHGREWYLTVTFRKDDPKPVCSKLERAAMDGPAFMLELERRYGKRITTRTWNTLQKIVAKMHEQGAASKRPAAVSRAAKAPAAKRRAPTAR